MVESFKELSRLCQKPRYKEEGNWMVRHITRDLALLLTRFLLRFNISANQVTFVSLIVGVLGGAALAVPGKAGFVVGAVLLQLWYYLDHVDGQIARYRGTASMTGRFFDFFTHHLIHGILFLSLGFYNYFNSGAWGWIVWGGVTSLCMIQFNLLYDITYKTFVEAMLQGGEYRVRQTESQGSAVADRTKRGAGKRLFMLIHKSCEIHVIMNLLTLAAFAECFIPVFGLRSLFVIFYGTAVPVLLAAKTGAIIRERRVDKEFAAKFECVQKQGEEHKS